MSAPAEPLYRRDGSRFVLYDPAAQDAPPILRVPVPVDESGERVRPEGGWAVPAAKCGHGHFVRWASRNCCAPR